MIGGDKIGMDCSVVPHKKRTDLSIISTTDFFYPLVDDPYIQGKIGACNVLSDMYALGVVDVDNMLMILSVAQEMSATERDIVTQKMIAGFNDLCNEADVECTGGQTVFNPWPIIGGTAMSVCTNQEFLLPVNAVVGDVLVLTKPLGTRIAVNLNEWLQLSDRTKWEKCAGVITEAQAREAYGKAVASMVRLNRNAAKLMHTLGAHAATDVTGFGILGHAGNLAQNQNASVDFEISVLPMIRNTPEIAELFPFFNLMKGTAAETSGGLLVALPSDKAKEFCTKLEEQDHWPAWIIGKVVAARDPNKNSAYIVPDPTIILI